MERSLQSTSSHAAHSPEASTLAALSDLLCQLPAESAPVLASNTAVYRSIRSLLDQIDLPRGSDSIQFINDCRSWSWQTLFEDTQSRYGLLHLPANGYIPLHDHADAYGLSLVLEGNPVLLSPDLKHRQGIHWISDQGIRARQLHSGQISVIVPGNNNIHGFQGGQTPSTLLSLTTQKTDQDRHWYFPENQDGIDSKNRLWRHLILSIFTLTMTHLPAAHAGECDIQALGQFLKEQTEHRDINHLLACAREDYPQAQFWVADAYQSARGVNMNLVEAAYWYGRAAEQGMPEAQLRYGEMMMSGEGITEDSAEALDWIFKSYMAGNKEAEEMFYYLLANPTPLDC